MGTCIFFIGFRLRNRLTTTCPEAGFILAGAIPVATLARILDKVQMNVEHEQSGTLHRLLRWNWA